MKMVFKRMMMLITLFVCTLNLKIKFTNLRSSLEHKLNKNLASSKLKGGLDNSDFDDKEFCKDKKTYNLYKACEIYCDLKNKKNGDYERCHKKCIKSPPSLCNILIKKGIINLIK